MKSPQGPTQQLLAPGSAVIPGYRQLIKREAVLFRTASQLNSFGANYLGDEVISATAFVMPVDDEPSRPAIRALRTSVLSQPFAFI